jgi:hypothetical protein
MRCPLRLQVFLNRRFNQRFPVSTGATDSVPETPLLGRCLDITFRKLHLPAAVKFRDRTFAWPDPV